VASWSLLAVDAVSLMPDNLGRGSDSSRRGPSRTTECAG
jgi:hypothetical protein